MWKLTADIQIAPFISSLLAIMFHVSLSASYISVSPVFGPPLFNSKIKIVQDVWLVLTKNNWLVLEVRHPTVNVIVIVIGDLSENEIGRVALWRESRVTFLTIVTSNVTNHGVIAIIRRAVGAIHWLGQIL